MSAEVSTIERALQLARSGHYRTITEIKRQLKRERLPAIHLYLESVSLKRQLRADIVAAQIGIPPAPVG